MSVSKIFLNFHWDIAMCDTINVWYIFWKASVLTNCKDSRIQKPLDGFHSLPLNFNFELTDFWLCRRNIVFIVSDKFTRPIKLFFSEAWRSQKGWKKVRLNGDHYIGRYLFFWCLPLGHIILHWSHEKIVLFGSNFLMIYSSWVIGANFLVSILWWSWILMKDATLL